MTNRPALKIEAETTQNRSKIILIVPCERSSWSLLHKSAFCTLVGKENHVNGSTSLPTGERENSKPFPLSPCPFPTRLQEVY